MEKTIYLNEKDIASEFGYVEFSTDKSEYIKAWFSYTTEMVGCHKHGTPPYVGFDSASKELEDFDITALEMTYDGENDCCTHLELEQPYNKELYKMITESINEYLSENQ